MIELFAQTEAAAGFGQFLLLGLVIGSLYALIALGYTMVYGIIELINFAHGDLFMLGSFLALQLATWVARHHSRGRDDADRGHGSAHARGRAAVLRRAERVGGPGRLQAAAQRPQTGPAGLGHRRVSFIFMNIGLFWKGATPVKFPDLISRHEPASKGAAFASPGRT